MNKTNFVWLFVVLVLLTIGSIYQNGYFSNYNFIINSSALSSSTTSDIKKSATYDTCINRTLKYQFSKLYPSISGCTANFSKWDPTKLFTAKDPQPYDYNTQANERAQNLRIVRGLVAFFPIDRYADFVHELRWLYRSWIEMMKEEPAKWRTDLVIFIDKTLNVANQDKFDKLKEIGCSFENRRKSKEDKPMCTLVQCQAIKHRQHKTDQLKFSTSDDLYAHLLNKVNMRRL